MEKFQEYQVKVDIRNLVQDLRLGCRVSELRFALTYRKYNLRQPTVVSQQSFNCACGFKVIQLHRIIPNLLL